MGRAEFRSARVDRSMEQAIHRMRVSTLAGSEDSEKGTAGLEDGDAPHEVLARLGAGGAPSRGMR